MAAYSFGLPLGIGGPEGPQAARVRDVATRYGRDSISRSSSPTAACVQVCEVVQCLAAVLSTKRQRGRLDMVAAAIILQTYLDAQPKAD